MQIDHSQGDHLLIRHKQFHQRTRKHKADHTDKERIDHLDPQPAAESLPDPLLFAGTFVLCQQRGHRMGDILLRSVGKIINAVYDCKRRHDRDSHCIDNRLDSDLAELYRRLLHGAHPAKLHRLIK